MKQVFKTRVTEELGIDHPIIQGGMMWVSQPELVAAVSEAGGLGVLTALTFETAEGLTDAIARTRALTDRPFGVNLTFLPTLVPKDYGSLIDVIVDEGIDIVETAGRNPEPYLDRIKAGGARVIHKCTSVRFAKKAESIGCDFVSIDGCECAGHPGEDDVTSLVLIPVTVDAVKIPVIASGWLCRRPWPRGGAGPGRRGHESGHPLCRHPGGPGPHQRQELAGGGHRDRHHVRNAVASQHRTGPSQRGRRERSSSSKAGGAGIAELAPLVTGKNGLRMLKDGEIEVG